ncbi:hypothetical protein GOP47_0002986 [Adiantum capillus-veneris]|uniref:Uncharacterized protein n=1 Tax=Adiantum capillus-veneris TaxID=13818 RepID=A0A9D4ZPN9_ADICA|nr:hypothetical protein GOP47_0002986 [Adiantum capillus-veneris]
MEKANVDHVLIHVDNQKFLPPAHDPKRPGRSCFGGVVLALDGRIVCENTLDARLGVVFKQKLPEIRRPLFGGTWA